MTAPLALGCESGGREAGTNSPGLEKPRRTEEAFWRHLSLQRNGAKLDPRGCRHVRSGPGALGEATDHHPHVSFGKEPVSKLPGRGTLLSMRRSVGDDANTPIVV